MKNSKIRIVTNVIVLLVLSMLLSSCKVPIDNEIVIEEEELYGHGPKLLIPSYTDYSGRLTSTLIGDYFKIINLDSEEYDLKVYEPPYFEVDWRASERVWCDEFIASKAPEMITIEWNERYIDISNLKEIEGIDQYQMEAFKNPYVVPIGAFMRNFEIRKSELIRVLGLDSMTEVEDMSLIEILDWYYASENAKRYIFENDLLNLAAESNPMSLPTPARYHHDRLNKDSVVQLTKRAYEFKKKVESEAQ